MSRRPAPAATPSLLRRLIGLVMMITMAAAPAVHGAGSCHPGMAAGAAMAGMHAMPDMVGMADHADHGAAPAPATVPDLARDCCGAPVAPLHFPPAAIVAVLLDAPIARVADRTPARPAVAVAALQPPATGPPVLLRTV